MGAEVTGSERLEALLRGEEPRSETEARRARLVAELRRARGQAPEELRARVLAAEPARPLPRLRLPSPRRAVLVAVAAVLAAIVALSAVQALQGGPASPPASVPGATPSGTARAVPLTGPAAPAAPVAPSAATAAHGGGGSAAGDAAIGLGALLALVVLAWALVRLRRRSDERRLRGPPALPAPPPDLME